MAASVLLGYGGGEATPQPASVVHAHDVRVHAEEGGTFVYPDADADAAATVSTVTGVQEYFFTNPARVRHRHVSCTAKEVRAAGEGGATLLRQPALLPPPTHPGHAHAVNRQRGLAQRYHIAVAYDVPYLDAASEVEAARVPYKHRMDVYYPTSALAQDERTPTACPSGSDAPPPMPNRPVMVFVHGGGWKRFDRRSLYGMHGNVGRAFARRGFVVCVISYRLSRLLYTDLTWVYTALSLVIGCSTIGALGVEGTKNKLASSFAFLSPFLFGALYCFLSAVASKSLSSLWHAPVHHPTHVVDACTAIAYIARNVSKWGGDASRMSIMGHSAGGHIVSYLVSHPRYLRDAMRLPLDTPMRTIFHSAVCLSGVYSCEQLALTRQYTWRKPWLAPLIWLRRMSFLHPAFGTKAEAWPLGFPTTHCADTNTLAACQLPPILCINASFDLGLGAHTDEWQEQLLAAGVHTERCTFTPADHARYVMQMDTPGSASELIICDVIHDFLLRTVPAKSSTA